jgi:hypothetical protein
MGGSEAKKGPGSDFFVLKSPHRETPKNVIKQNRENLGLAFIVDFLGENFSTRFFGKTFL